MPTWPPTKTVSCLTRSPIPTALDSQIPHSLYAKSAISGQTVPWGVWGWREWVDSMLAATDYHIALIYLQPSNAINRLIDIRWRSISDSQFQLRYTLNASRNFNSTMLADSS